jgi:hypothetical protein
LEPHDNGSGELETYEEIEPGNNQVHECASGPIAEFPCQTDGDHHRKNPQHRRHRPVHRARAPEGGKGQE